VHASTTHTHTHTHTYIYIYIYTHTHTLHHTHRTLNIGGNTIEDAGIKALSEAIASAGVLETLDVSHNHITDAGIRHVADMLKKNPPLTSLDLSSVSCFCMYACMYVGACVHEKYS
jgi:Ran GTPase-activating protein (RanGAP) involved in mRNA processing and transport